MQIFMHYYCSLEKIQTYLEKIQTTWAAITQSRSTAKSAMLFKEIYVHK